MSDAKDWVAEARERCDAATIGPWRKEHRDYDERWTQDPCDRVTLAVDARGFTTSQIGPMAAADAAFIIHARVNLPRALDVIEAADRLVRYLGMAHVVASVTRDTNPSNAANVADLLAAYRKVRG